MMGANGGRLGWSALLQFSTGAEPEVPEEEGEGGASWPVRFIAVVGVILAIIALLQGWETLEHHAKHGLPANLMPAINSMFSELAALGFIGVLLGYVVKLGFVGVVSVHIFGDEETLLEAFEWLHTKFFEVAILYFLIIMGLLLKTVRDNHELHQKIKEADTDGDGDVTPSEFITHFGSLQERSWLTTLLSGNLGATHGDTYLLTRRFVDKYGLSRDFDPVLYLEATAAKSLRNLADVSPWLWLIYLIPLAILQLLKISHDVPGDDDHAEMAGFYLSNPIVMVVIFLVEVLAIAMVCYLYAKMASIKSLLRPQIERSAEESLEYLSPSLYEGGAIEEFSKGPLVAMTNAFATLLGSHGEAHNEHHELFGKAGHKGPELFLQLLKGTLWLLVGGPIFCFPCIVFVDIRHMALHGPTRVVTLELLLFGAYGSSFVVAILWVVPAVFALHTLATSFEGFKQDDAVIKGYGRASPAHAEHH